MDYLVLARKLRPARFADLIGQDTVVRILRNAIRQERVAHAFLFAGARGVGKTSAARILTKLWNCLDPRDAEPCNACANCIEITRNASPDVYEIDAASNRGIDNIRELRDNTKFAPAKCRYKTYIIDEVHMLTTESFNALLKTLEEPPPHVKFILATTSPHKIPETILSRCQRFDFSRIPVALMADYLAAVTAREGIAISRHALEAIARNAAGGMRDALTALDQVVSFCGNEVADGQVHQMLGLIDSRAVLTLLGALLDRDLNAALAAFGAIVAHGHDLQVLLEALLREIKDLSLFAALGGEDPYFQDHPPDTRAFLRERAAGLSQDVAQQLFQLFLELEGQLKRSQFAQACFEMALVKASQVQSLVGVPELLDQARALLGPPAAPGGAASGGAIGQGAAAALPAGAPAAAAPRPRPAPGANPFARPESRSSAARVRNVPSKEGPPEEGPAAGAERTVPRPASAPAESAARKSTPAAPGSPAALPTPAAAPAGSPVPEAASAPAAGPAETAAPGSPLPPESGEGSPEQDPRWQEFVARVYGLGKRRLAAHLRQAEIVQGGGGLLELIPRDAAARGALLAEEQWLAPPFAEAFGAGSRVAVNRDTNRVAAAGRSLFDRRQAQERARREGMRQEALQDEAVRRVQRLFPEGKVDSVTLPEPTEE